MKISELVEQAHKNAKEKGFYDNWNVNVHFDQERNNFIATELMLIVTEVSEAMEALRKGDMENFAEELADIPLRVASLCGLLQVDLEQEIKQKMEKNKARGYMHGKRF